MTNDVKRVSEPDGVMPDGTPIYLKIARGNGKPMLQLEIYRRLCEISDEEWASMKDEVAKRLGWRKET